MLCKIKLAREAWTIPVFCKPVCNRPYLMAQLAYLETRRYTWCLSQPIPKLTEYTLNTTPPHKQGGMIQ